MKRKLILLFCIVSIITSEVFAQAKHTFQIKDGHFLYDGQPIQIHSGEMHFARVPKPYWRHRLQMMKAMGLNAVASYVFWNYHEVAPGVWDFETGNRDIRGFIKAAQEEGMMVILRPGPYACAEWEFGGYPWWLQKNKDLVIRTNNKPFLDSCKVYINKLADQVRDLQVTAGGPIVMVQAENEFGSYVSQRKDIPMEEHKAYNNAIKQQLLDAGFDVPLFTSDGSWLFEGGALPGVLPTANGENDVEKLKTIVNKYNNGQGPYMVAEFYPGWLDHWGEKFVRVSAEKIARQTEEYLKKGVSINYYMVHGGTNFGFTSGANYNKKFDIQPDITSYDYDAPISEAGWATPKYDSIRTVIAKYSKQPLPKVPDPLPLIEINDIKLEQAQDFLELAADMKAVENAKPLTFEELNQGYGYVLYRRQFNQPISGKLNIEGLRDFATVYVDGEKVGELNRINKNYSLDIEVPFNGVLDILVENMGRINYGSEIVHNLKGIISPVKIDSNEITGSWQMFQFPMAEMPRLTQGKPSELNRPALYKGTFKLNKTGDTFLDMQEWGKGIVFVNGHHLGRYWKIGPQQTLYLPGCWLKKGANEIVIFEQLNEKKHQSLKGIKTPILDDLKIQ